MSDRVISAAEGGDAEEMEELSAAARRKVGSGAPDAKGPPAEGGVPRNASAPSAGCDADTEIGGDPRAEIAALAGILVSHELKAFAPALHELGARDGESLSRLVESELQGTGA